ncbi:unnamed protein product [Effrenium voratum]|nr:unnamed protein product [Effrenium voratum]
MVRQQTTAAKWVWKVKAVEQPAKRRLVWKVKEQPRSSAPVLLGRLEDAAAKAEVKAKAEETRVAQKDVHAPVDIGDKADEVAASMEVIRSQLAHCEQGGAILAYMRAACWRCAAKDTQEEHGGDNSTEEEDKSDIDVLDEGDEEPACECQEDKSDVDVLDEGDEVLKSQLAQDELGSAILAYVRAANLRCT